jgi:hypothetical protein
MLRAMAWNKSSTALVAAFDGNLFMSPFEETMVLRPKLKRPTRRPAAKPAKKSSAKGKSK